MDTLWIFEVLVIVTQIDDTLIDFNFIFLNITVHRIRPPILLGTPKLIISVNRGSASITNYV